MYGTADKVGDLRAAHSSRSISPQPNEKANYQTNLRKPLIDKSHQSLNISASQIDLNNTADPHFNNSIELTRSQLLLKQRPAT